MKFYLLSILFWHIPLSAKLTNYAGSVFPEEPMTGGTITLMANLMMDSSCDACTVIFDLYNSSGTRKHRQVFNETDFSDGALRAFGYNLLLDEKYPVGIYTLTLTMRDRQGALVGKRDTLVQFQVQSERPRFAGAGH